MQVVPKNAPAQVPGHLNGEANKQAEKRERAIAAFTGQNKPAEAAQSQSQATPVSNPSKVAPEELSAIKQSSKNGQLQATEPAKSAEATSDPAKATEQKTLSPQDVQLERKEKALRAHAQALKAREDAIKAKEAALAAPAQTPQEKFDASKYIPIEEFKKNPWKYTQEAGVTYDDLTQQALNAPSHEATQLMSVVDELKAEIKALRDGQDGMKKGQEDAAQAAYKQAVDQIRTEVNQLVGNGEEFEAIKATGSQADVVELIEKTFKEDGYVMDVDTAAKQVEEYLAEEAYRLSQLKKIQARLKPKTQEELSANTKSQNSNEQPQIKTLSNAMSTSRQLSARERALAAAQHGPNWKEKI